MVTTKTTTQVADLAAERGYRELDPLFVEGVEIGGIRTLLSVPMLKNDELVGAITLYRQEVRPFTDKQIALVTNFAAQAVVAIENTRLLTELRESLEQQTATAEVLGVISRSKFDLQPILQSVVETAERLCRAEQTVIFRLKDGAYRFAAGHSHTSEYLEIERQAIILPGHGTVIGRAVLTRQVARIDDAWSDPLYEKKGDAKIGGARSMIGVPLMRQGEPIGAIGLARSSVDPFTDREIELVATFADQAVIAIENARLFEAEQQRTRELTESLEQQTATSEVLQVISSSPGDLEPVFETMLENAVRICDATFGNIHRWDGEALHILASLNTPAAFAEFRKRSALRPSPEAPFGRMVATKTVVHVTDLSADPAYIEQRAPTVVAAVELGSVRTILYVPMLKEKELIGAFTLSRSEVRPFTDKQIAVVTNFAAQAVISIENARLLGELRESLERQTATSEILRAIAASPGDAEGSLHKIAETTAQLFDAAGVSFRIAEGDEFKLSVGVGQGAEQVTTDLYADPALRPTVGGRNLPGKVVRENRQIHLPDLDQLDSEFADWPGLPVARRAGIRTIIGTPLRTKGAAIGALVVYRNVLRPFEPAEMQLLQTFADQAVIAIENARLLSELREALEQQTATAEVLSVISSSPGDLVPVFDAMLASATRICEAGFGMLWLADGGGFRSVALHGVPPEFARLRQGFLVPHFDSDLPFDRLVRTRQLIHIADIRNEPGYSHGFKPFVELADVGGARTLLLVPMLKEQNLIGAIAIYRQQVRPFGDKQIALLANFAAQAVIAIENTRLLGELRELLEQQTATANVLEVISRSAFDLPAVFDTVVESSARLCAADRAIIHRFDGELLRVSASFNTSRAEQDWLEQHPIRPGPDSGAGRAATERRTIHNPDILVDPAHTLIGKHEDAQRVLSVRSIVWVPILKGNDLLGVLSLWHSQVRPFTEKQIALVETFADQATIAIENARLFEAEQQRTRELTELLEQQTATANVLSVISASPGDLAPVFDAMLESATRLCEANFGTFFLRDGGALRLVARHVPSKGSAFFELGSQLVVADNGGHPLVRVLETKDVMHLADLRADPSYAAGNPRVVAFVEKVGSRTALCVPMMKDDECIGVIVTSRPEVRPFTDKQIDLVKNFAAQAVIAIENARLLSELRELLERQTATSKVLEVISSSPGELEPVFTAMLENAVRICDATFGNIYRLEGRLLHLAAAYNTPPALAAHRKNIPMGIEQNQLVAPMMATKSPNQVLDAAAAAAYTGRSDPAAVTAVELGGVRTSIAVPMLKDNELIGSLSLYRQEVRPFTDKQIALVAGFANQAVIAIENARLLTELRESLEQQTATADVLRVISSSPGELEPVFTSILDNATRICQARFGTLFLREGESLRVAAHHGSLAKAWDEQWRVGMRLQPDAELQAFQTLSSGRSLQVSDLSKAPSYLARNSKAVNSVEIGGIRTMVTVPLLKDGRTIGVITIFRTEVRDFSDKQVALVESFAAQAVIAIENARLLGELRARTDELARSVEELRALGETSQAVNSTLDLEMVLNTIVAKAVQLSGTEAGAIYVFDEATARIPPASHLSGWIGH